MEEPALAGIDVEVGGLHLVGPQGTEQIHAEQVLSVELCAEQALSVKSTCGSASSKPSLIPHLLLDAVARLDSQAVMEEHAVGDVLHLHVRRSSGWH
jgi:hypothetical protein